MMEIEIKNIKDLKIFSDLKFDELSQTAKYFSEKTVEKGKVFLVFGETTDYLYFIVSGFVKIYQFSEGGRELVFDILKKGDVINISTTFSNREMRANALAMTPVVLYLVKKADFKLILRQYPDTGLNALKILAEKDNRGWTLARELSFSMAIQRLCRIILKIEEEGDWPRLTQYEIAAMIGASRKAVNRALKVLEDKGAVKIVRNKITVTDTHVLKHLSSLQYND